MYYLIYNLILILIIFIIIATGNAPLFIFKKVSKQSLSYNPKQSIYNHLYFNFYLFSNIVYQILNNTISKSNI